jgi:hypothetical protein
MPHAIEINHEGDGLVSGDETQSLRQGGQGVRLRGAGSGRIAHDRQAGNQAGRNKTDLL